MEVEKSNKDIIRVKNPRSAYAKIASLFAPEPLRKAGIHQTAVIDNTAQIGNNVSIHPHVVIEEDVVIADNVILAAGVFIGKGVKISKNTIIHANVVIEYNTLIGSNVIIHAGTVIGSDGYGFVTEDEKHIKIPQLGKVIIEDEVEIGANVTVDRGTSAATIIHRGTKIDNLVQVAHNVEIGEDNLLVAQTGIAGSTKLGKSVTLAGQTGVVGHLELEDNTIVASKSLLSKNTNAGVFYSGIPAQEHKKELRLQAASRKVPELLKRIKKLEREIEKINNK